MEILGHEYVVLAYVKRPAGSKKPQWKFHGFYCNAQEAFNAYRSLRLRNRYALMTRTTSYGPDDIPLGLRNGGNHDNSTPQ